MDHRIEREGVDPGSTVDRIALFEMALESAGALTWVWDLATDVIDTAGSSGHEIFDADPDLPVTGDMFLLFAHPDDRRMLMKHIGRSITTGESYAAEYRATRRDGEIRWHSTRGEAIRDASGAIVRLAGVSIDITEHKRIAEALRTSEERVQAVLASAPIALMAFDVDGTVTLVQGKALADLGIDGSTMTGLDVHEVVAESPDALAAVDAVLAGSPCDTRVAMGGRIFESSYQPVLDDDGVVTGGVVVATDVTDRVAAEQELARQALYDPLTDLANRILFNDRLELQLRRGSRHHGHTSVLFLDLDGFKAVNDRHGHHVGDELLRAVADRLRRTVRPDDTVARFGGDEFLVLGEVTGRDDAEGIAARIIEQVSKPYEVEGHALRIGVSVGIALAAPDPGGDVSERAAALVRRADVAMYAAKQAGRGRSAVADEVPVPGLDRAVGSVVGA